MAADLINRLKKVKAFVFDFDGVFTNGKLLLLEDGEWLRHINVKDVFAVTEATEQRYRICITGEHGSVAIVKAFEDMGVRELYFDAASKTAILEKFIIDNELDASEIMYMGDDLSDLAPMGIAGFTACPRDAVAEVKEVAHFITESGGGEGCVREVVEMVLRVHQQWNARP